MDTNNNFTDHTECKSKSTTRNWAGTKKEIVNTACQEKLCREENLAWVAF